MGKRTLRNAGTPPGAVFDITKYVSSYADKQRLKDIEIVEGDDGATEIIDHSIETWAPSERQQQFFEVLFDVDSPGYLDIYDAMKQLEPPGTCREVIRWCNTSVQFTAYFKEVVDEKVGIASLGSELTISGAAEGAIKPTKDQKWAAGMLLKIKEFAHQRQIRWVQINQQFNFGGVSMDNTTEQLQQVVDEDSGKGATGPGHNAG